MGPYARTGLVGIVSCGVLFTAVLIGRPDATSTHTGTGVNAKDERPQPGPYVALGDSYTSGPKIPRQSGTPAGCERSDHNYPSVVARQLGVPAADFRDVSCSGATLTDLTAPQKTSNGTNPAQLSALSTRTRLVTLGIGGNDIGFGSTVTKCVMVGAMYRGIGSDRLFSDDAPCRKQYVDGGTDEVARKIQESGPKLSAALAEIERRAPNARVYVVGYPAILPADGKGCGRELPLAPGDATYLHDKGKQLNTMLREQAEAAGATYVDTYSPSVGHDACSEKTRWTEPFLGTERE
ncbi:SGNH/GDSL hydrolase family protein [Streptomyces sp. WI04-05B]|uniref:SGNH/GDSL hydrolase family protein n=1 Tax=Streptomyces TaxID=1883 RepID=UPI0029B3F5EB|nr:MULTISPECIES: SGNH/GDSL hydrolase family protein [unclassified Streptomyces]MDX2549108.1 SGNH/GDSL hydrolase family protein [Streptomyces sp. WI04-05B]MDX2588033.1 SGNH/GDSL hydrolase family protein [Streptomyces sp. WI04-05A]MDX3751780.1 SGNH/GDSL hydrolase family protein [Streptomyces sp. AK08-02]